MKCPILTVLLLSTGCAASTTEPARSVAPSEPIHTPTTAAASSSPSASSPSRSDDFAAPPGFEWRDRHGDFALAAEKEPSERGVCEVWNVKTHARVASLTSANTVAGGADPICFQLSPRGTLVEYGNGRNHVWKNLRDEVTSCVGVVAPDDASCLEVDVTPFMFVGKDGERADLDLHWSQPIPNGPLKKVATIVRGLNRDGGDAPWWKVRYCSATRAVIEIEHAPRVVVDPASGAAHTENSGTSCP